KEVAAHPDNATALVDGVTCLARLGEKDRAKEWAFRAQAIDPDDPIDHYNLACALAQMNEPEQAIDMLESSQMRISAEMVNWMKEDSDLVPLREHPRFKALIARGEARLVAIQADKAAKAV